MKTEEACRILRAIPSLAIDCRIDERGAVHRPRRPLVRHEALAMVKAWCVLYQDEPSWRGKNDGDTPRADDEKSVADWLDYCFKPLGWWPKGGDALHYGDPVL